MKAIELEKAYNPKDFEDRIYAAWVEQGHFHPQSDAEIVLPFPCRNGGRLGSLRQARRPGGVCQD